MDRAQVTEYDVVVLGGGTGGYSCALRGSELGLSVALVEQELVGGTCLHRGCIPSKALLHAAQIMESIEDGTRRWGIDAAVRSVDAAALAATRDDIVSKNFKGLVGHLELQKVSVIEGRGRLTSPRTITVTPPEGSGRPVVELRARRGLVIATGSTPKELPGLASDGSRVVTSDQATRTDQIPRSVAIIGAGPIGVEFATFYRAFGAEVTLVEMLERVLPGEDPDVSAEMARALRRKGISVLTRTRVEEATVKDGGVHLVASDGASALQLSVEVVLSAIGRSPVSEDIGLEDLGVVRDRGFVQPGNWDRLETHVPGVHVVGDLLPPPSLGLAHASFAEGLLVAEVLAGRAVAPIQYPGVVRATYSLPEAASVGLSEPEAKQLGFEVEVNRFPLTGVAKGVIYGQGGMVKVLAERGGPVLGVHLVGPHVTDLIAEGMLMTNWEALPAEVAEMIHPHPSLSEAVGEALLTLAGRRLHQLPSAPERAKTRAS